MDVLIRNVDIQNDIEGVREAHGADEHWGSDRACLASQKTRLENGFFIRVAEYGGKIVGHAEWIISDEPGKRFLYLGMMQVHTDYQKTGIGTKLLETGEGYAKESGCGFVRTMPNTETGSFEFYRKNGFAKTKDENSTMIIKTTSAPVRSAVRIDKVPSAAVSELPFAVGLYQHSSRHMWNVYNAQSECDDRVVSSYSIEGSYVNIGAFEPYLRASVTCWSGQLSPGLIAEVLAVGGSLGYKHLSFCVLSESVPCFDSFDYEMSEVHDIFMEKRIG